MNICPTMVGHIDEIISQHGSAKYDFYCIIMAIIISPQARLNNELL